MVFHGIDLHTDSFVDVSLSVEDGPEQGKIKTEKYYLDEASFVKFKSVISKEDYIIVEACTNAFWFQDQIKDLVKQCFVLNVNKYKASVNKTDKIDGKKLVKKLAFYVLAHGDQDDLPMVFVPPAEVRELRALFSTYQLNKKTVTQYKNRIHSILKQNGIVISRKELSNPKRQAQIIQMGLSQAWKLQIEILLKQIEMIEQETETIKELIYEIGNKLFKEDIEILLSIKGFSPLTAIALMSDVVDINRFSNVKQFCAYLRTAPKVKGSNKTTKIGSINKFSRSLSCTLLSQSVEHFAKSGEYLSEFYGRIKVGKKAGVYRMAMIRKILVCAFYMLKRKKQFYWVDEKRYNIKLREFRKLINEGSKKIA
ncbi:MAG TPA: IS110 family transposase [Bacteroidales bacterium]|nr:IS110 family transposase [Bacteroidales bacterium]